MGGDASSKIPDFSHYRSKQGSNSNLVFQYFMVGTLGALTAAGAKATVQGTFGNIEDWILGGGTYIVEEVKGRGSQLGQIADVWPIRRFPGEHVCFRGYFGHG
jgi:hypothetical protein